MRVTIVPEDRYIQVDGRGLNFDFLADTNIHAIQWYDDYGTVEQKVGGGRPATLSEVQLFVDAFNAETARIAAIVPDPPLVPGPIVISVTPWQIRKALNVTGLRASVETAVAAADQETKDGWEFATEFRRDNPIIETMGTALGKTPAELDALFALAQTL